MLTATFYFRLGISISISVPVPRAGESSQTRRRQAHPPWALQRCQHDTGRAPAVFLIRKVHKHSARLKSATSLTYNQSAREVKLSFNEQTLYFTETNIRKQPRTSLPLSFKWECWDLKRRSGFPAWQRTKGDQGATFSLRAGLLCSAF